MRFSLTTGQLINRIGSVGGVRSSPQFSALFSLWAEDVGAADRCGGGEAAGEAGGGGGGGEGGGSAPAASRRSG